MLAINMMRLIWTCCILVATLLFSSCSRHIIVKPADYLSLNEEKFKLQIITISGKIIRTNYYSINGDTLTVNDPGALFQQPTNVKLHFSQIREIKNLEHTKLTLTGKIILGITFSPLLFIVITVICSQVTNTPLM